MAPANLPYDALRKNGKLSSLSAIIESLLIPRLQFVAGLL
jgi:hypothetical protein